MSDAKEATAEIAGGLMAAATFPGWAIGQWMMLSAEEKAAQMEDLAMAVEEKEKEMMEKMAAKKEEAEE